MKKEILEKALNTRKNLIVEGDIFSGKTNDVMFKIVDNAISNEMSLFIVDAKEEYIKNYQQKLLDNGYNTIILNLRDMPKNDFWNPLEYPYTLYKNGSVDKAQEYLEVLGKDIFCDDDNASVNSDSNIIGAAVSLFVGTALSLFSEKNIDDINLRNVYSMFNLSDEHDYFLDYINKRDVMSKEYILASIAILAPKDTSEKILSLVREKLGLYVSRSDFSFFTSKTTFNIDDIINKKTAIILVTKDENTRLAGVASMFIEQLYLFLVDCGVKYKFNFILDNFDVIRNCNGLIDILGSSLSRNIKCYLVTRMAENLSNKYGDYIYRLCDVVSLQNSSNDDSDETKNVEVVNGVNEVNEASDADEEVSEVVLKDFGRVIIEDDLDKNKDQINEDIVNEEVPDLGNEQKKQSDDSLLDIKNELENVVPDSIPTSDEVDTTTSDSTNVTNNMNVDVIENSPLFSDVFDEEKVSVLPEENHSSSNLENNNIESLIKQIDKEINGSDEENDDHKSDDKNNIISELAQFKID